MKVMLKTYRWILISFYVDIYRVSAKKVPLCKTIAPLKK